MFKTQVSLFAVVIASTIMIAPAHAQQSTTQPPAAPASSVAQKTMTPVNATTGSTQAKTVASNPSAQPKASLAANTNESAMKATVVEVKGTVETAPDGTDPTDIKAWKPIKEGDQLGQNVMIRTGLRSRCVLMFGEEPNQTVISVRRATLARISEFAKTPTEQRIRMGLGYGAIRGGSSEGTLRSDVVINSTVATLAKRGTEGFELEVEPTTGRFRISLAQSGLVEALSRLNNQRRTVSPGQYATNGNIAKMWVNQDIFDRCVRFYESEAVSDSDLNFIAKETTGLSNLGPAGRGLFGTSGRNFGSILNRIQNNRGRINPATLMLLQDGAIPRPEGSFGFGQTFRVLTPHFERPAIRRATFRVPRPATLMPTRLIRHRSGSRR
ncbi:MAG: hypothetical protein DHS20C16_27710 [Phycisphaerae bacterium]|nr:MAG: hypothetical protein DHS20C16_27710 [Phycisphaerae bacterium]